MVAAASKPVRASRALQRAAVPGHCTTNSSSPGSSIHSSSFIAALRAVEVVRGVQQHGAFDWLSSLTSLVLCNCNLNDLAVCQLSTLTNLRALRLVNSVNQIGPDGCFEVGEAGC